MSYGKHTYGKPNLINVWENCADFTPFNISNADYFQ